MMISLFSYVYLLARANEITKQESAKHMPGESPLVALYFLKRNEPAKAVAAKSFPIGGRKNAVFLFELLCAASIRVWSH
jgi:hypothetical protein